MKKLMLAVVALVGVALAAPAPASAHGFVSFSFGVPGFGLFVGPPPCPRPVVYPAPVYYPGYYPPYYSPYGAVVVGPPAWGYYGYGYRSWRHGARWR